VCKYARMLINVATVLNNAPDNAEGTLQESASIKTAGRLVMNAGMRGKVYLHE
jgi:hypothetical protein